MKVLQAMLNEASSLIITVSYSSPIHNSLVLHSLNQLMSKLNNHVSICI